MTSLSDGFINIHLQFLSDGASVYGEDGLAQATAGSVGVDLRACLGPGEVVIIPPKERRMVATGIAIEPKRSGIAGFVYSRSGLGGVHGITVAQGVGVIDPDYRGEIKVPLLNTGQEPYTIQRGDRIAQLVFQPYYRPVFQIVDTLAETGRGTGGFGHTGK